MIVDVRIAVRQTETSSHPCSPAPACLTACSDPAAETVSVHHVASERGRRDQTEATEATRVSTAHGFREAGHRRMSLRRSIGIMISLERLKDREIAWAYLDP